jgi:DEAD/DEAH box helicase domain-containing protein
MPPASRVPEALERLRRELGAELVAELRLPEEGEERAALEPPLPPPIAEALARRGIGELWSHQVEALTRARAGRDVLLTTATASGKSLVFQLPPLEEALAGGPGRALWLFPLKALGQDQRAKFRALAAESGLGESASCEIYDGDTPAPARAALRRSPPRVLITNPDMLHLGLLPHAAAWHELLRDLRWVVLDELHAYRGLFGCHLHHVLRRLERLAGNAGARFSYVAASATAAEADAFADALTARCFDWIRESGAPREARHLLLVRPTGSPYTAALAIFAALVRSGLKTIAFTKARRITELLWTWLERREPELARRVRSYRSGYLPFERREIERALFAGELDGVLSTSALELGIDIGGLDACVLVGYPGSVMATWQRAGRVGRSGRESIIVLVALPDALDQYLLDHPRDLIERPFERLVVDPDNEPVARQHLVCAAAELPLSPATDASYLERFAPAVGELLAEGALARRAEGGDLVSLARRPQRDVSLRGSGAEFAIVDTARGATIGTIDGARVFAECHPGAIYLHGGRQYSVTALDLERHVARVEPADVDWYTSPRSEKETEILEALAERTAGSLRAGFGRLKVTEQVVGFERRRTHLFEAIDVQPLDLPPSVYETQGLWIHAPAASERELPAAGRNLLGALHAVEHAAIGLFPLVALCDRSDLGGISLSHHPQLAGAGLFVYEGHVGGVGIAKRGFHDLPRLLTLLLDHLERCPCESGCPSCIQSPKCGNGNRPLDKAGAIDLLRAWLVAPAEVTSTPSAAGEKKISIKDERLPLKGVAERAPAASAKRRGRSRKQSFPSMESLPSGSSGSASSSTASAVPGPGGTVLFDVETLRSADEVGGWNRAHRMGVALAVALQLESGEFAVYREAEVPALIAALKGAGLVIGFNSLRFDYAVLSGYTGEDYARTLPSLDLLESLRGKLGFRVGLDHVARETLGRGKSGDGLQSLEWVKEGRFDLVEAYCRQDVELLRDVYLFGRRERHVVVSTRGGRIRVEVDW